MGPLSFLILYAHVLCRAWYMRRVDGGEVYKFVLWPFGSFYYARHSGGPSAEIKIALVDHVLVGIPLMVLFGLLYAASSAPNIFYIWCWKSATHPDQSFFFPNLWALGFNICFFLWLLVLIPVYPFDGGRLLAAILLSRGKTEAEAASIIYKVAAPTILALVVLGIVLLATDGAFGMSFLVVGLWGAFRTYGLYKANGNNKAASHPIFKLGVPIKEDASTKQQGPPSNYAPPGTPSGDNSWGGPAHIPVADAVTPPPAPGAAEGGAAATWRW